MFKPLTCTKTCSMAAASLLSVTLVPVAMGRFVRARICRERANPLNRALIRVYRPVIDLVLGHRGPVILAGVVTLIVTWIPFTRIGSEFMPRLVEGTILYMPTTLPGLPVARAREIVRQPDVILKSFPEVEHVWGRQAAARLPETRRGST